MPDPDRETTLYDLLTEAVRISTAACQDPRGSPMVAMSMTNRAGRPVALVYAEGPTATTLMELLRRESAEGALERAVVN